MTWTATATKHGYLLDNLPKSIKKKIANYNEQNASVNDLQKDVDAATDDDKPEMQTQLDGLKETLSKLDLEIAADIETYHSKKAFYDERSRKMQAGRKNPEGKKAQTTKKIEPVKKVVPATPKKEEAPIVVIPVEESKKVEIPAQQAPPKTEIPDAPIEEKKEVKEVKEKTKSNTGIFWVLGGILLGGAGWGVATNWKFNNPFKRK